MKRDKIHENGKTVSVRYAQSIARNNEEAVNWLIGMEGTAGFETMYVALRDLSRSADEGKASRQLSGETDAEQLLAALSETPCEKLYLAGRLHGVPVGIGISLADFIPSVTVPREHEELAALLESRADALTARSACGGNEPL